MSRRGTTSQHHSADTGSLPRRIGALASAFLVIATTVVTASTIGSGNVSAAAISGLPHPMTPANGNNPTGTALFAGGGAGPATTVPNNRVRIVVSAGGDRTNPGDLVAPLAGAQFAAWVGDNTSPWALPADDSSFAAWCTTDATGTCHMQVTAGASVAGYRVAQIAAPANFSIVQQLATSDDLLSAGTPSPYRFFVPDTTGGTVTAPPAGSGLRTSAGDWMSRRNNPGVPPQCGLDIGVLVDLSSSVNQTPGAITSIRDSLESSIDLLHGTGSRMAIHTFSTSSPSPGAANTNLGLTPISGTGPGSGYQTLVDKAAGLSSGGGQYTNWDRGLWSFANIAADLDVVMVLTDGVPTAYGSTTTGSSRFWEFEEAIASANYLKTQSVQIMAVGIGTGATGTSAIMNLQSISGDTVNQDYGQVANFSQLEQFLTDRVQAACAGTVNVTKNVIPFGSPPGTVGTPTAGWTITAQAAAPIVRVDRPTDPDFGTTASDATDVTGVVPFRVDFSNTAASKTLTISETPQPGFHQVPFAGGKLAQCTNKTTNTPLTVTNYPNDVSPTGFQVTAASNAIIDCVIQNQAEDQSAALRVHKVWNVDIDGDGIFNETLTNTSPTLITGSAALNLANNTGLPVGTKFFGTLYSNLALNSTVNITEELSSLPPLCTNVATTSPALGAGGLFTLTKPASEGVNEVTITNTVTCQTKLTLAKHVVGGTATADQWLLDAIPADDVTMLAGPNGVSGATANVTPSPALYGLAEVPDAAVAPLYVQDFVPTQQSQWDERRALGSTGSWACVAATSVVAGVATFPAHTDAVPAPGQVDGRNGGVQVPPGNWYRCTANNRLKPTLQLVKQLDDNGTITTVPVGDTRWTLTAGDWVTPVPPDENGDRIGPFPGGAQANVSGAGGVNPTIVLPGTYTLSESSAPAGYVNGTMWSCRINGGDPVLSNQITLAANQAGVCTIVNTVTQPTLTLKKSVVDLNGTASPSAEWTLTATNTGDATNVPINGKPTDAAAGITAPVRNGATYQLTESDGLPDYTAETMWVCAGGTFTAPDKITLGPGQNATCTITNKQDFKPLVVGKTATATFDRSYQWSIAKAVDQTSITTTPGGDAVFGYTVTVTPGSSTDSGWALTGQVQVTNANNVDVPVTLDDVTSGVNGGVSCSFTGGASVTVPANATNAAYPYTCTFTSQPTYTGGTNQASATWTAFGGGAASSGAVPVDFQAGKETNKTVDVVDDKTTATPVALGTATWNDTATPAVFTYNVTQIGGAAGTCASYTNTATISQTSQQAQQTVQVCVPQPFWTIAKSANPASGTAVGTAGSGDPDNTIVYTLTAKNPSQATVEGAIAVDTLPDHVTVTGSLPAGLTLSGDGRSVTWNLPSMAPGATVSVSFTVTVNDGAGGADGTVPLVNVVAPTTPNGSCESDTACTTSHPVKRLLAAATTACVSDAAFLAYSFSSVNVPDAGSLPVTATWRTESGTVARVDTIPAGQTTGSLLWPGMVLNTDGVAIGWPGWRDLQPSDFPLAPGATIYGTQILDTSLASNAYRLPMTVTFSMNPSDTVPAQYPDVTPQGCAVPRDPSLSILKTASATTVNAGDPFNYSIAVSNTSTLGVAYPVRLSDPISPVLQITSIATSTTDFPRWVNCAVTGVDADGFGGTLNCELNGALGVSSAAPVITLTAVTRPTAASGTVVNTATVCWLNPSDPAQAQRCAASSVPVDIVAAAVLPPPDGGDGGAGSGGSGLPQTGAQVMTTLMLAGATFALGSIAVIAVKRRRRIV